MEAGFARHEPTISTNEAGRYRTEARITGNGYSLKKLWYVGYKKKKRIFFNIYSSFFLLQDNNK